MDVSLPGASLLLVDSDPDLLRDLTAAARRAGYAVTTATALEALQALLASGSIFDAAVIGLPLGDGTGYGAIRHLHLASPETEIIVTVPPEGARTSSDLAVFALVQKPADVDDLVATVGRAVAHRRTGDAHRRQVWELRLLNDIALELRRSLETEDRLKQALQHLVDAFGGQGGSVRLLSHRPGGPDRILQIGPAALVAGWRQGSDYPLPRPSDEVLRTKEPAYIPDFAALTTIPADQLPIRSAISVPLWSGGEMLGTLSVGSHVPDRFSDRDRQLILTAANQLGIAAQNARLHALTRTGREQWEATFDSLGELIALFDSEGRLIRGNVALAAALGRPVTTLPGLRCDDIGLCVGTFPDCAVGRLPPASSDSAEVAHRNSEIYSVTTSHVSGEPSGVAVVQIAKNVTEDIRNARRLWLLSEELAATNGRLVATVDRLKTTQAQLLQAEKLSAIGQLVAGVAHELNNPLTSVIGYAQLVEEELRETPAEQLPTVAGSVAHDVRRIAEESERAARIVRNLLAFARRQTAARSAQDLADLVSRVLALRAYEFRLNGIEVQTEFEAGLPHVQADAGHLQQALLNLILNAEHAMRGRPTKRLRLSARYDPAAAAVELRVTDTGHGIADENLRKVFDPFFTTHDVGDGAGLGLSICYGIIHDHGGQISVDSGEGEGTTFTLLLPAPAAPQTAGRTAVVSCAHEPERDHIVAALRAWGLQVQTVEGAVGALDTLRAGTADVLFADKAFINTDPGAWQRARALARQRTFLVVLDSAGSVDPSIEETDVADLVLVPPFDLRALRSAVDGVSREYV